MIDLSSSPGSWRSALAPNASCAACGQAVCDHADALYQGVVPFHPIGTGAPNQAPVAAKRGAGGVDPLPCPGAALGFLPPMLPR